MMLSSLIRTIAEYVSPQDARYIIKQRTGLGWADCVARPETVISEPVVAQILADLDSVKNGVPLSRIYGVQEFWGRDFGLSPDTLDPRIDTETLISSVLKRFEGRHPRTILDLGTGSGCILVTLLCAFPQSFGVGIDLSEGAVRMARENALRHGVASRVAFLCGNWADCVEAQFDLIVSNPPYIENHVVQELAPEVVQYDPILALAGGEDGLEAYKAIFLQLPRLLEKDGRAFFEIGFDQGETVPRLGEDSGVFKTALGLDSVGLPRVVEMFFAVRDGDK